MFFLPDTRGKCRKSSLRHLRGIQAAPQSHAIRLRECNSRRVESAGPGSYLGPFLLLPRNSISIFAVLAPRQTAGIRRAISKEARPACGRIDRTAAGLTVDFSGGDIFAISISKGGESANERAGEKKGSLRSPPPGPTGQAISQGQASKRGGSHCRRDTPGTGRRVTPRPGALAIPSRVSQLLFWEVADAQICWCKQKLICSVRDSGGPLARIWHVLAASQR